MPFFFFFKIHTLFFFTLASRSAGRWLSVTPCLVAAAGSSTAPLPPHGRGTVTSALLAEKGTFIADGPKFALAEPALGWASPWRCSCERQAGLGLAARQGQLRMTGVQAKSHSYEFEYLHQIK